MRGRRITWRGGFTQCDGPTLTTFHNGLQQQFGLVPVGAPVYRTFGADGKAATALYQQGTVTLHCVGDTVLIEATIRADHLDWQALKSFAQQTFGLRAIRRDQRTDYLAVVEDEIEV